MSPLDSYLRFQLKTARVLIATLVKTKSKSNMKHISILAALLGVLGCLATAQAQTVNLHLTNVNTPPVGLWNDTGISLTNGEAITINANGIWIYDSTPEGGGADGFINTGEIFDTFISNTNDLYSPNGVHGSVIAYIGTNPISGGNFPTNIGYWEIGSSSQFVAPASGKLWLGNNDDAITTNYDDNVGSVNAQIFIGYGATNDCAGNGFTLATPTNTDNTFTFEINGPSNCLYAVYESTDLNSWTFIGTNGLHDDGTNSFEDDGVSGVSYRFYKLDDGMGHSHAIGFVRLTIPPGYTAIANQLDTIKGNGQGQNSLDALFNAMPDGNDLPNNSTITEMDSFGTYHTYTWSSGWGGNGGVTLEPGGGALIYNPTVTNIVVTFAGLVREGNLSNPIIAGQGIYSSMVPQAGGIQTDLGYEPQVFDNVYLWNTNLDEWNDDYTYTIPKGGGTPYWLPSEPEVNVGQSVLIAPNTTNDWERDFTTCFSANECTNCGNIVVTNPVVSSNSFSFTITAPSNSLWAVYDSSDLQNWVLVDQVSLTNTGSTTFANNTGVPYRFYKLDNGVCHSRVIGFTRILLGPNGTNGVAFIANQFDTVNGQSQNSLDALFNPMPDGTDLPSGSQITEIDSGGTSHTYTWNGTSWGGNGSVTLEPGSGAGIKNGSTNWTIISLAGLVREGTLINNITTTNTLYYSSMIPQAGYLQTDLGYTPKIHDTVYVYNNTNSGYNIYSYASGGVWTPSEPEINVGQSFYIAPGATNSWQINYSACAACFTCP